MVLTIYAFTLLCFLLWMPRCNAVSQGSYPTVLAEQLNQYCDWRMTKGNSNTKENTQRLRIGKAGPRGWQGPEGKVNYTVVEQLIAEKIADRKYDEKFEVLMEKVARLEEKLQNKTAIQDSHTATKIQSQSIIRDCYSASRKEAKVWNGTGGVFDIYPDDSGTSMEAYCDLTTDGGGWIVFQRRMDGSENFQRDFADYVAGFGSKDKEFWLGLEKLHILTKTRPLELRVDLTDWDNNKAYATYSSFKVGDASSQYKLTIGGYSGTAGDSLAPHNGQKFYTRDRDNARSAAGTYKGGWWFFSSLYSNLNGNYKKVGIYLGVADGVSWFHWKRRWYSMKFVEMKMR